MRRLTLNSSTSTSTKPRLISQQNLINTIILFWSITSLSLAAGGSIYVDPFSGSDVPSCYLDIGSCRSLNFALGGINSENFTIILNVSWSEITFPIDPVTITTNFTMTTLSQDQTARLIPSDNSQSTFTFSSDPGIPSTISMSHISIQDFQYNIFAGFIYSTSVTQFSCLYCSFINVSLVGSGYQYLPVDPSTAAPDIPVAWPLIYLGKCPKLIIHDLTLTDFSSDSNYGGFVFMQIFPIDDAINNNFSLNIQNSNFLNLNTTPFLVQYIQSTTLFHIDSFQLDIINTDIENAVGFSSNIITFLAQSSFVGYNMSLELTCNIQNLYGRNITVLGREGSILTSTGLQNTYFFGNLGVFFLQHTGLNSSVSFTVDNITIVDSDAVSTYNYRSEASALGISIVTDSILINSNLEISNFNVENIFPYYVTAPRFSAIAAFVSNGLSVSFSNFSIKDVYISNANVPNGLFYLWPGLSGTNNKVTIDSIHVKDINSHFQPPFTILAGFFGQNSETCSDFTMWPPSIPCSPSQWDISFTNSEFLRITNPSSLFYLEIFPKGDNTARSNNFILYNITVREWNVKNPINYFYRQETVGAVSVSIGKSRWFILNATSISIYNSSVQSSQFTVTSPGIAVYGTSTEQCNFYFTDCVMNDNYGEFSGAIGIYMANEQNMNDFIFKNLNFTNNFGFTEAGAVAFHSIGNPLGINSFLDFSYIGFSNNTCQSDGGAVSIRYGVGITSISFYYGTFSNNTSIQGSGGAVAIMAFESFDSGSSTVYYPVNNKISFDRIGFQYNSANASNGGTIFSSYPEVGLQALDTILDRPNTLTISDCTFASNTASVGAVLYSSGSLGVNFTHTFNDSVNIQDNSAQLAEIFLDNQLVTNLTGIKWRNELPRYLQIGNEFESNSNDSTGSTTFTLGSSTQLVRIPLYRSLTPPSQSVLDVEIDCPIGYYYDHLCSGTSGLFCSPCPITSYSLSGGSNTGISTLLNQTTSLDDASLETGCSSIKPQKLDQSKSNLCLECPTGGVCSGGSSISTLPNFWGLNSHYCPKTIFGAPDTNFSHDLQDALFVQNAICFISCPTDYCCQEATCQFNYCHQNRSGMLCGSCQPGYSLSFGVTRCVSKDYCSDVWSKIWLYLITPFLTFSYMTILILNPIGKNPYFKSLSYVFQILPIVAPLWQRTLYSTLDFSWTVRLRGVSQASSLNFSLSSIFEHGLCPWNGITSTQWMFFPLVGPLLCVFILTIMFFVHRTWCTNLKFRNFSQTFLNCLMVPWIWLLEFSIWRFYFCFRWIFRMQPLASEIHFPEYELGRFDSLRHLSNDNLIIHPETEDFNDDHDQVDLDNRRSGYVSPEQVDFRSAVSLTSTSGLFGTDPVEDGSVAVAVDTRDSDSDSDSDLRKKSKSQSKGRSKIGSKILKIVQNRESRINQQQQSKLTGNDDFDEDRILKSYGRLVYVPKAKLFPLWPNTEKIISESWDNYWVYEMRPNYFTAYLTVLLMAYSAMITVVGELLNCVQLPDKTALVIFRAGDTVCYQTWQIPLFFFAFLFILPFPYYINKVRIHLRSSLPKSLEFCFDLETVSIHVSNIDLAHSNIISLKLLALLEGGYRSTCLDYETIFMARRLLIQSFFVLFNEPIYSSLSVSVVCLGIIALNFHIRPFGKKEWQRLEDSNLIILSILSILNAQAGARASSGVAYSIRSNTDMSIIVVTVILILIPILSGFFIVFRQLYLAFGKGWTFFKNYTIQKLLDAEAAAGGGGSVPEDLHVPLISSDDDESAQQSFSIN